LVSIYANMKKYNVYISKEARADLKEIADYIADILKAPYTSKQYAFGIVEEIKHLSKYAESIPISTQKSILYYGNNARRVNFKKTTIIYTIQVNTVIIQRIIAGSMIIE